MFFKEYSKITLYIFIIIVCAIIGITFFSISFDSWAQFGQGSLSGKDGILIPTEVQVQRAISLICLIIFSISSLGVVINAKKIPDSPLSKKILFTGGVFSWIFLPLIIKENTKEENGYKNFVSYLFEKDEESSEINNKSTLNFILGKEKFSRKILNTLFTYFIFLSSFIGLIFIFIIDPVEKSPELDAESNILFSTFSYFTQLTNLFVFIYSVIYLINPGGNIFRKNMFLISTTSYIVIVGLIFWAYLFPVALAKGFRVAYPTDFSFVKTFWLHAVTPISFVVLFVLISSTKTNKTTSKFLNLVGPALPYPLLYGLYIYILPFISRITVYGALTNTNPNMFPFDGDITKNLGSYINFVWMGLLAVIFILFFFIFWKLNSVFHKKNLQK
ncbi:MAG: DUF1600 domain-containing protein [Metamycoplasmataceae bacterium]